MSALDQHEYSDDPYLVVSGDSHAGPRLEEDLRTYCPGKRLEQFDDFVASFHAQMDNKRVWSNASFAGKARSTSEELDIQYMSEEAREAALEARERILGHPGSYDPIARLRDMDADGIASEVIFAGAQNRQVLPWAGDANADLRAVGGRIYNEWLADFCSVAPERFLGVAEIPIWDVDAAVKEVIWAKEHGLRAINFPAPRPDYPAYNETDVYEPFWSTVEEVGLPLVTHSASGESASGAKGQGAAILFLSEVLWLSRRGLGQMIFGGVFDRHPGLTVAFVEQRGNWVQETLRELDSAYIGVPRNAPLALMGAALDVPDKAPTEYWRSNCIIADSFMAPYEAAMCHEIGLETLMWGSDYPHLEGTWPRTRAAMRHTFAGLREHEVRTILGLNGARVFNLDMSVLQPIVDRIGPTPKELAEPLAPTEFPAYRGLAFREAGSFH